MFSKEKPGGFEFTMNKKILIIEDDAAVGLGCDVRLKADNYDTFFAPDGLTSVTEASQHHPDVIMLDLGLPGDDDSVVIENLKTNRPSCRDSHHPRTRSLSTRRSREGSTGWRESISPKARRKR
jgi:CheY-like chemotaxis protein